jgi:hypothetical protein
VSIVAADRKMIRYRSRRSPDTELRARLRELANHLTATGHRAEGRINGRGPSRHWMKVQWQVTRSKRSTKARAA